MSEKKHNDPLEQFFKEKISEYDISYREDDWLALEKKLDERAALLTNQRRIRFAAAAIIFLFSLIGYFIYQNNSKIDSLNNKLDQQIANNKGSRSDSENNEINEQEPRTLTGEVGTNKPERKAPSTLNNDSSTTFTDDTTETNMDIELVQPQNPESNIITYPKVELVSLAQSVPFTSIQKVSNGDNFGDLPTYSVSANANKPGHGFNETTRSSVDTDLRNSGFDIGIMVSPDLSATGTISQFEQPGYKLGLRASYQLTSNISIQTGIIWSKVRYSSGLQNYDPSSYPINSNNLNGIYAECMILDVPISLTYNFLDLSSSRFFVSAGFSSYVMLSEDYKFRYEHEHSYPYQETNYSVRSGNTHLFSNTGFSLGYEFDIHENWSIIAEPFIKIPLREVGWGKVKLYSVGTFISLNYRL